jgi:hypothetical protein
MTRDSESGGKDIPGTGAHTDPEDVLDSEDDRSNDILDSKDDPQTPARMS